MTDVAVAEVRPNSLVRFFSGLLIFGGLLVAGLVLATALLSWGQPRVSREVQIAAFGRTANSYRFDPGPRTGGLAIFLGACAAGLGGLVRQQRFSLRRLVLTLFVAGALGAFITNGGGYGPSLSTIEMSNRDMTSLTATAITPAQFETIHTRLLALIKNDRRMREAITYFDCSLKADAIHCITQIDRRVDNDITEEIFAVIEAAAEESVAALAKAKE